MIGNHTVYVGDTTVPPVLIAGLSDAGEPISVDGPGWLCRTQLLDHEREKIGTEQLITATQSVNEVPHFYARITPEQAQQMVNDPKRRTVQHYFSVQLENQLIGYRHTLEIPFNAIYQP